MQAYSISPGAQVSIGEPQPRTHGPRTRAASRATSCRADTAPRFPDRTLMHIIRPAACGRSVEASCQVASSHDLSIAMQTDDLYMPEPQINVQQSPLTDHASAHAMRSASAPRHRAHLQVAGTPVGLRIFCQGFLVRDVYVATRGRARA